MQGNDVITAGLMKINLDTYGSGSVKSECWEFVFRVEMPELRYCWWEWNGIQSNLEEKKKTTIKVTGYVDGGETGGESERRVKDPFNLYKTLPLLKAHLLLVQGLNLPSK